MTSDADRMAVTRWWWVRHAPVVDAHLGRLSGQADIPAVTGDTDAFQALAAKLPRGAVWIVSPLKRTRQTAETLWAAGAERVEPLSEKAFAEQAFGGWTGLTWTEIGGLDDPLARSFWDAPASTRPPGDGAESFAEVCARTADRIEALTRERAGRDIVCVAHAGPIRAAVALALGLEPERALALDIRNTALTRLDHIQDGLRVKRGGSWRVGGINM